jgi:hypothetical protein
MTNDGGSVESIERQLSKLESTATNLQTVSALAARANRGQEARALSDQAVDLRVKQFALYRNKDRLQVDSKDWKACVSALETRQSFDRRSDCRPKSHQRRGGFSRALNLSRHKTRRFDWLTLISIYVVTCKCKVLAALTLTVETSERDAELSCLSARLAQTRLTKAAERARNERWDLQTRRDTAQAEVRHRRADESGRIAEGYLNQEPTDDMVAAAETELQRIEAALAEITKVSDAVAEELRAAELRVRDAGFRINELNELGTTAPAV